MAEEMKKYRVTTEHLAWQIYECTVEAESEEEAKRMALSGEGEDREYVGEDHCDIAGVVTERVSHMEEL